MRSLSSIYLKNFYLINKLFIFNNLYSLDILNNMANIYWCGELEYGRETYIGIK